MLIERVSEILLVRPVLHIAKLVLLSLEAAVAYYAPLQRKQTLDEYSRMIRPIPNGKVEAGKEFLSKTLRFCLNAKHATVRTRMCGYVATINAGISGTMLAARVARTLRWRTYRPEEFEFLVDPLFESCVAGVSPGDLTTPSGVSIFFKDIFGCLLLKGVAGEGNVAYTCDLMHLDSFERRDNFVSFGCLAAFDSKVDLIIEKCTFADSIVKSGDEALKCRVIAGAAFMHGSLAKHMSSVHFGLDDFSFQIHEKGQMSELQANLVSGLAAINDNGRMTLLGGGISPGLVATIFPLSRKGLEEIINAPKIPFENEFDMDVHTEHNNVRGLAKVSPLYNQLISWWRCIKEHVKDRETRCMAFANVVHELYSNERMAVFISDPRNGIFPTINRVTLKPCLASMYALLMVSISTRGTHGTLCELLDFDGAALERNGLADVAHADMPILHPDFVEYSVAW